MLSRICTDRRYRSLHPQNSYPHGPYRRHQTPLGHDLCRREATSTCYFFSYVQSVSGIRNNLQRVDAQKRFLCFWNEETKTRSSEMQISVKEDERKDNELRLAGWESAFESTLTKIRSSKEERSVDFGRKKCFFLSRNYVKSSASLSSIDHASEPALNAELPRTEKEFEELAETDKTIKVIQRGSKTCAEVHSIVIRRRITNLFLRNLQEKIDFLHSEVVPISEMKVLLKKRAFLSASPQHLVTVVKCLSEFFESKSIAFDVLTVNAGMLEKPLDSLEKLLCILTQFELSREACIKLGVSQGMWMINLKQYEEILSYFKGLGMDANAMSLLIFRCPLVLRQNVVDVKDTVEFLKEIGVCHPKLVKLLQSRPTLFASSVENDLKLKFKLFQDWGFTVDHFLRALRHVSCFGIKHMVLRYDFLREQGLSHEVVTKILRMQPCVLVLSEEDIKAKLDYLFHTLNCNVSDLERFPPYLGYSLKDRIMPRFNALEEVGLHKKLCLSSMLSLSTPQFKVRYNIPESVRALAIGRIHRGPTWTSNKVL